MILNYLWERQPRKKKKEIKKAEIELYKKYPGVLEEFIINELMTEIRKAEMKAIQPKGYADYSEIAKYFLLPDVSLIDYPSATYNTGDKKVYTFKPFGNGSTSR